MAKSTQLSHSSFTLRFWEASLAELTEITERHSRNQKKDKNVHIRVGATLVALQGEAEASPTQLFA